MSVCPFYSFPVEFRHIFGLWSARFRCPDTEVFTSLQGKHHPNCQPRGPGNASLSGVGSRAQKYRVTDVSMQLTREPRYWSCGIYHETGLFKSVNTHNSFKYHHNHIIFTRFYSPITSATAKCFYVLLTVHLSIFISVFNQLDAQNFCFTISLFHASTCFEHHVLIITTHTLSHTQTPQSQQVVSGLDLMHVKQEGSQVNQDVWSVFKI